MELHPHFGSGNRHVLAGTDVDGHPLPAPVIDVDSYRCEGLSGAVRGDAGFLQVALELTAYDIVRGNGADRTEQLHLLIAHALHVGPVRGLHAEKPNHLHQVVFDDISQASRGVIKRPATINAECLGHRDLDIADVVAVPDRLEECIGETGVEDVLRCLFAQIMIDAEDLTLLKDIMKCPVEGFGRCLVMTKRFLHHDAGGIVDASRRFQPLGDRSEKNRRDRQIVNRTLGSAQSLFKGLKGRRIAVVPVDILKLIGELLEVHLIHTTPVGGDSLPGAVNDLLSGHATLGDSDDRPLKNPTAIKRLNGVEEFLMSQISRCSEEDKSVAFECGHDVFSRVRDYLEPAGFSWWPPNSKRIAEQILSAKRARLRLEKRS